MSPYAEKTKRLHMSVCSCTQLYITLRECKCGKLGLGRGTQVNADAFQWERHFSWSFECACGGLNRNGYHAVMCLNAWPIGSGTTMKYGLIGVGVAFLEEVCHCGVRLWGLRCSGYGHCGTQSPPTACWSTCRTLAPPPASSLPAHC